MTRDKVVLAYSGGLDTSVAIKWLQEKYSVDVIAAAVDVGQPDDLSAVQAKATRSGAAESLVIDAKQPFADDFIAPALAANALYERRYPLPTALARPLIAAMLVKTARERGAAGIAHGCTGKGNDQVRFDVAIAGLAPELKIYAPAREWGMTRDEELDYAQEHGIEVPVTKASPYSVDENMYGRSIEAGALEDPWQEPPADVWSWTKSPEDAPKTAEYVEIGFAHGRPVSLNGESLSLIEIIKRLNSLAGLHGIGRIDMVENRIVGIKSRETYECPAALVLTQAHSDLESLTLPRELARYKYQIEDAFIRLKLFKGAATVVGRQSEHSLYDLDLATYDASDRFSHESAKGFIELFGLPTRTWADRHGGNR
jgi:argininosuccinate synthase